MEVSLAPIVVVRRLTMEGMKMASDLGLSAVVYVHNMTSLPKQVQELRVSGDVEADFGDYNSALGKDGMSMDDIAAPAKRPCRSTVFKNQMFYKPNLMRR